MVATIPVVLVRRIVVVAIAITAPAIITENTVTKVLRLLSRQIRGEDMPSGQSPTYKSVLRRFEQSTPSVRWYLDQLPALIKGFPWEVSLAWVFLRVEQAQHRALYCGVVKLHRAHRDISERAINGHHMTRTGFNSLFANVFGRPLSETTGAKIAKAERVRDRVIHGKDVKDAEMRDALVEVIEYAELLNAEVKNHAGAEPFGRLTGFKGRGKPLDQSTSRWLLRGIGFTIA